MIAVDTNIPVYCHREDSPLHDPASRRVAELAEGASSWAIPWPRVHEFLAIVTHPRIYLPPTPLARALDQVEAWLESPTLVLLAESATHWTALRDPITRGRIAGPPVHDARIVVLCRQHRVRESWSADRDFGRFADLTIAPIALVRWGPAGGGRSQCSGCVNAVARTERDAKCAAGNA